MSEQEQEKEHYGGAEVLSRCIRGVKQRRWCRGRGVGGARKDQGGDKGGGLGIGSGSFSWGVQGREWG